MIDWFCVLFLTFLKPVFDSETRRVTISFVVCFAFACNVDYHHEDGLFVTLPLLWVR